MEEDLGHLGSSLFKMIEELERVLLGKFAENQVFYKPQSFVKTEPETYFRLQLLEHGASAYLATKLPLYLAYFASFGHLAIPFMLAQRRDCGNFCIRSPVPEQLQLREYEFDCQTRLRCNSPLTPNSASSPMRTSSLRGDLGPLGSGF